YFEHPSYVPLLHHAYKLWHELEEAVGRRLLHVTGIAEIGPPESALVRGTLACAHLHALRHELLTAPELMRRFPAFRVPPDYVAVVQPDGGVLEVEPSIAAQLTLAVKPQEVIPGHTESADRWLACEANMRPVPVVAMEPSGQRGISLL